MQICLCHLNVAIDLPGLPQIPAPVTDQSCAAASSANTLIGVGCPHAPPSCANLHSARRSRRHRLPFPAGSFIEGFRTPATVQAASLRSAGIRNPQQTRKSPSVTAVSVHPPGGDITLRAWHVRFVPGSDMAPAPKARLDSAQRPRALTTFVSAHMAAPASKKAPPSATSTSPGHFDLMPKPLPNLSGSSVSRRERSHFVPLNRPRQIG